jgi:hypothetical protein
MTFRRGKRIRRSIIELGQRAAGAETLRRLPDANVAALKRAGPFAGMTKNKERKPAPYRFNTARPR